MTSCSTLESLRLFGFDEIDNLHYLIGGLDDGGIVSNSNEKKEWIASGKDVRLFPFFHRKSAHEMIEDEFLLIQGVNIRESIKFP